MQALPFVFAFVAALALAPVLRRALSDGGLKRPNHRGRPLPCPFGIVIVAAAFVALIPVALIAQFSEADIYPDQVGLVLLFVPGVALLGLIDDALAGRSAPGGIGALAEGAGPGAAPEGAGATVVEPARGWRGHGAAVRRGEFSTGALKAVGTLGLALLAAPGVSSSDGEFLLVAAVLVLATNVFNLLDLRPGRSIKVFVLLGAGLTLATWETDPLAALGLFAGPVLVAGFYDLREHAMLGDTGSNLVGALAGLWLVLSLGTTEQLVALVLLALLTAYGEFRSISAVVERTPVLRHLDSFGRP